MKLTRIKRSVDEQVWIVLSRDLFRTVRRAVARLPSCGEDEEAIIVVQVTIVDAFRDVQILGRSKLKFFLR